MAQHYKALRSYNTIYNKYYWPYVATSGTGNAYPFGAPAFTHGFYWNSCHSIFRLCVCWTEIFQEIEFSVKKMHTLQTWNKNQNNIFFLKLSF